MVLASTGEASLVRVIQIEERLNVRPIGEAQFPLHPFELFRATVPIIPPPALPDAVVPRPNLDFSRPPSLRVAPLEDLLIGSTVLHPPDQVWIVNPEEANGPAVIANAEIRLPIGAQRPGVV